MGAFLLVKRPAGTTLEQVDKQYASSLQVFRKKGMEINRKLPAGEYVLYTFHKSRFQTENTLVFDDGQFIAATGTLIYRRRTGREGLRKLFQDFSTGQSYLAGTLGQYGLIVYQDGELFLANDYTGYYHIYSDKQRTIISSSFLAVLKSLPQRTAAVQELYEFVLGGSCFGGRTFIEEIELLDHKGVIRLSPEFKRYPAAPCSPPYIKRLEGTGNLTKLAERLAEDMIDYFAVLKDNFGSSICSPLTGGIHSRLMLGCMKRVGIKPAYMYIFGDPENKIGRDANAVPIARAIADSEGLELDFIDTTAEHKIDVRKYKDFIEQSYYLGDGLGHEVGLFHPGFNPELRLKRAEKAGLVLNGAGGETFRNYWVLPDRPYHIDDFIKARYDSMDQSIFPGNFTKKEYFANYREKILKALNTDSEVLSRKQIEMAQPDFENRYWMGNNNSINCQISDYLTPWADAQINYQACDVPLKHKDFSVFESALMRVIDPGLAAYPTAQGVDMLHNKLSLKRRLNYTARRHIPVRLKAYLRTHFYNGAGEHLSWKGNKAALPYNLSKEYLQQVFPSSDMNISAYFNIEAINNPAVLSRALTAELIIGGHL